MDIIKLFEKKSGWKYHPSSSPAEYIYNYFETFFEEVSKSPDPLIKIPSYQIRIFINLIKKGITINDLIIKIAAAYEQIFNNNDYFIDSIEHVNSLLLSDAKYNNYNWFTEITPLWTFVRILHWSTKKFRKFISEEYGILIKDYQFTSLKTFKDLEILINNQIKDKECEDKQIAFRTPDSPSTKSSLIKEDSSKKRVQPKESETIEDFDFENIVFSEE